MKIILDTLKTLSPLPKFIQEALKEYGTLEVAGVKDNPKIIHWAKELGTTDVSWYSDDSIPWCGLFTAIVVKRTNREPVKEPLRALSWSTFGIEIAKNQAELGDILVFVRKGGGHVGFYVGESVDSFFVLGGNQADSVNITRISKSRLYTVRRPIYNIKPNTVKKYYYTNTGKASENEA